MFYSQFKEHKTYEKIVSFIADSPKNLEEISKHLKMKNSGGLKYYLQNLEQAHFIAAASPYQKNKATKLIRYQLSDEYLRFYFKYIRQNRKLIELSQGTPLFKRISNQSFEKWLGFAFERFCYKNALFLAEKMGFSDKVISYGPVFSRKDKAFQLDLVFLRSDHTLTVCEMKFYAKPVGTAIIPEIKRKTASLSVPRGYTVEYALISSHGSEKALKEAEFFHHDLSVQEWF